MSTKLKPEFTIGFELEGLVRNSVDINFENQLRQIDDRLDYGGDGSVCGSFLRKKAERPFYVFGSRERAYGAELRTPPLPLAEGLTLFSKVLAFLNQQEKEENFFTNKTCGLHVNLSEKRMSETFQNFIGWYSNIVELFPEHEVLARFNRTRNSYCLPLFPRRTDKRDADEIFDRVIDERFGRGKYHSVGLVNHGYMAYDILGNSARHSRVEFRCLGNADYHKKEEDLHFAFDAILEAATEAYYRVVNPNKNTKEARELSFQMKEEGSSLAEAVGCLS